MRRRSAGPWISKLRKRALARKRSRDSVMMSGRDGSSERVHEARQAGGGQLARRLDGVDYVVAG